MAGQQSEPVLPELRQDLTLERGADGPAGTPSWLIVDPAQHRYIQINEDAYQILTCWQAGQPFAQLIATLSVQFRQQPSAEEIAQFVRFLSDNSLTVEPSSNGWKHYSATAENAKHGWMMWAIHNYLFIKLPLFRPEAFLKRLLPLVAPLYSRTFLLSIALTGAAGLYLVSRQWDVFRATFQHFFSLEGALTYALALGIIKSAHELGHAFTALRFGCRVPSMGVCFLVMFPVLYTDVTDAWRLTERRQRLLVGSAGIIVELAVACLATFLWPFLPEGVFKSLAFSIATIGWVLSLAVNLNPLMRFDGYYLFADALGVDNLQSRSFAFGRWRLREILFALNAPPPETLKPETARILTVYAWAIWLYRLVVFTGIAVLVYHMAFKVLGIVLFLVEIIYFIVRPVAAEMVRWWADGHAIRATGRSKVTFAAVACALGLAIIPWSSRIAVPAVLEAKQIARIYPARAGVVSEVLVKAGDRVKAGDPLIIMTSPDIDFQMTVTARKIALVKLRLERRSSDEGDRAKSLIMERELVSQSSQLKGLQKERSELTVRAPADGLVAELNTSIHPGRAISRSEMIALLMDDEALVARGYISERDLARVEAKAQGRFIPDQPGLNDVRVQLFDVANSGTVTIEVPELASVHGGLIGVRPQAGEGGRKKLVPVEANYLATMTADPATPAPRYCVRGVVQLDSKAQSLAVRAWRQVAAVLVRESGF